MNVILSSAIIRKQTQSSEGISLHVHGMAETSAFSPFTASGRENACHAFTVQVVPAQKDLDDELHTTRCLLTQHWHGGSMSFLHLSSLLASLMSSGLFTTMPAIEIYRVLKIPSSSDGWTHYPEMLLRSSLSSRYKKAAASKDLVIHLVFSVE